MKADIDISPRPSGLSPESSLGVYDTISDRLHVNLHAGLEALLRESRYLLQLGIEIPRTASGVYRRDKQVRMFQARLQLLSDTANRIRHETPPVVAPLLEESVLIFQESIVAGLQSLTWNSIGVEHFLAEAESAAKHVEDRQKVLIATLGRIAEIVQTWHDQPFFPFDEEGMLEVELRRPVSSDMQDDSMLSSLDGSGGETAFPSTC